MDGRSSASDIRSNADEVSSAPTAVTLCYIYALCDPISGVERYVGSTLDIESRFRQHISSRLQDSSRRGSWIRDLYRRGLLPKVIVLARCAETDRFDHENLWIEKLRGAGRDLLNRSPGDASPSERIHFTVEQAAEWAGVSAKVVRQAIKDKTLKANCYGGRWMTKLHYLEAWQGRCELSRRLPLPPVPAQAAERDSEDRLKMLEGLVDCLRVEVVRLERRVTEQSRWIDRLERSLEGSKSLPDQLRDLCRRVGAIEAIGELWPKRR